MKYLLPYAFAREHHWLLEEDAGALTLVGSRQPAADSALLSAILGEEAEAGTLDAFRLTIVGVADDAVAHLPAAARARGVLMMVIS